MTRYRSNHCGGETLDRLREIVRKWPVEYKTFVYDRVKNWTTNGRVIGHRVATNKEMESGSGPYMPIRKKIDKETAVRETINELVDLSPNLKEKFYAKNN